MVLLFLPFVAGAHNAFTRFLLCCLKCCFWCLEHFIKFMNRNAYIMVSHYTFSRYMHYITLYIYNYHITAYIFNVDSLICLNMKANVEPVLSRNRLTERRNALTFIVRFWFMSSDFNIREKFLFLSARCFLPVNEERYEVKLCTAATFIMSLSRCEAARTLSHTHTHTPVQ